MVEHRISQAAKNKSGKQWYRDNINYYDTLSFAGRDYFGEVSVEWYNKSVNYDLFNGILNKEDYEYVTKPWGDKVGELPATLANRDISSSKIKAVCGIEYRRAFPWLAMAVNPDATTRREQEEFGRIRDYVVNEIMAPIKEQIAANSPQDPQQAAQYKQEARKQIKYQTPYEVMKYMQREYQDPASVLANQILQFLFHKERLKDKFNKGFKHAAISADEVYWIGEINGEPKIRVINPLFFDYDKSPDNDFIEDSEWAVAAYRMTPSEIVRDFGEELTNKQKEEIFEMYDKGDQTFPTLSDFTFEEETGYVKVIHCVWKSLRKIGVLTYLDMEGKEQQKFVDESYSLNKTLGDISIDWKWIPEVHEGYKIGNDIYVGMGPITEQHKDLSNLYDCKLPYYGTTYDEDNATPTSLMDRIKPYQYLYNILMYRMELLVASDKGRKAFINIGAVPRSAGITLKEFEYFLESNQYTYLNPNEEGNRFGNIGELVKEIDLSNTSDISKYVNLLDYIENQAGKAIGVPRTLEGQIQEREAVANVNSAVSLSTNILEYYFQRHDQVKRNVLQGLLETAKVAYVKNKQRYLSYVLDDMSVVALEIDKEILDSSTYGVFIVDSNKAQQNKEILVQLAHAAMQNDKVPFSAVMKVLQAETPAEAEEILLASEQIQNNLKEQSEEAMHQREVEMLERQKEMEEFKHKLELEKIQLEEDLKYKREIARQTILALGFTEEDDLNKNNVPDPVDAAKLLLQKQKQESEAALQQRKLDIEEKKIKQNSQKK